LTLWGGGFCGTDCSAAKKAYREAMKTNNDNKIRIACNTVCACLNKAGGGPIKACMDKWCVGRGVK